MGTTRKLAIAAYQATHPQAKKPISSTSSTGRFLGTTVAIAASCITGASAAQNISDAKDGGGYVYTPTVAPLDATAFAVLGASAGVAVLVMCAALIAHRAVRQFATGARIEPLSDVVVYNNPGFEVIGIAYEAQAPAVNPATPAALTGVKEAFVETEKN